MFLGVIRETFSSSACIDRHSIGSAKMKWTDDQLLERLHKPLRTLHSDLYFDGSCLINAEQIGELAESEMLRKPEGLEQKLLRAHLVNCQSCRKEYDALLDCLRELQVVSTESNLGEERAD